MPGLTWQYYLDKFYKLNNNADYCIEQLIEIIILPNEDFIAQKDRYLELKQKLADINQEKDDICKFLRDNNIANIWSPSYNSPN